MSYPSPTDVGFTNRISLSEYPNLYRRAFGIGFNPDIDILTVPEDCWGGDGLFNWPAVATQMQIRSTDVNDTAAGTGMRTLTIAALDASYNEVTINITLNGTTAVQLPSLILRQNGIRGLTAGSVGTNVGTIILEDTVGVVPRGTILAGSGVANQAPYTVPAGFTLIVPQLFLNVGSPGGTVNQFAQMRTWFRASTANACAIQPLIIGTTNGSPYPHMSDPPIVVAEKTDFSLRMTVASDNNTTVTAAWNGFLRKNPT